MTKYAELAERLRAIYAKWEAEYADAAWDDLEEELTNSLPLILSALADADRLEVAEHLLREGWSLDSWLPEREEVKFTRGDWDKDTGECTPEGKTLREALDAARKAGR